MSEMAEVDPDCRCVVCCEARALKAMRGERDAALRLADQRLAEVDKKRVVLDGLMERFEMVRAHRDQLVEDIRKLRDELEEANDQLANRTVLWFSIKDQKSVPVRMDEICRLYGDAISRLKSINDIVISP